jgi:18S rRNA (guanine1575-N7)-methyltransferase
MSRPEHIAPASIYYNEENAEKYADNSRMSKIQRQMCERALQLLLLPEPLNEKLVLDLGCGTGMSCESMADHGISFIGCDISDAMLREGVDRGAIENGGDFIQSDMGSQLSFRDGIFDGVVSISALQWLLNADGGEKHEPYKRLRILFTCVRRILKRGGRAVFQFYPETADQVEMITSCAMRCGFGGGIVVDFPHSTRAKKTYLVIHTGFQGGNTGPVATPVASDQIGHRQDRVATVSRVRNLAKDHKVKSTGKSKKWIVNKKERQRKQGMDVKSDSKYTGRKRKDRF